MADSENFSEPVPTQVPVLHNKPLRMAAGMGSVDDHDHGFDLPLAAFNSYRADRRVAVILASSRH